MILMFHSDRRVIWIDMNYIFYPGCVGALRENTALLAGYAIFLAILLLIEMTCGILGFIFKVILSLLAFQRIIKRTLFFENVHIVYIGTKNI